MCIMELTIFGFGFEIRFELILLCVLLIVFIQVNTFVSCSGGIQEGFDLLDNIGANLTYNMGKNMNGGVYDMQFTQGDNSTLKEDIEKFSPPYENEFKDNEKNKEKEQDTSNETTINIYKDLETNNVKEESLDSEIKRLDVFENTKFSPECCPSNYSSSTGCACMTPEQMKFLGQRGGNRTLNTEY
jgi:hypothetical protein